MIRGLLDCGRIGPVRHGGNRDRPECCCAQVYCARGQAEVLLYMAEAAAAKRSAIAVDPTYCDAIFLKGFALIDLGQAAEARRYIERAAAMAPRNAYFRAELAESYKTARDSGKRVAIVRARRQRCPVLSEDPRPST